MKPIPVRLCDFPFSGNGYKVRLALAYLGMRVDYEVVGLLGGDSPSERFLAKSPMGQIPVLELEDGTLLRESNSILYWLADGTDLMPSDLSARTRIVQWFCFEQSNIDKVLGRTRFLKRYPDFMATRPADWEQWYSTGYRALAVLEGELDDREFLVGNSYSVADICLYGYVHCAEEEGFDLKPYPSIDRWRLRVQDQPGHHPINEVGRVHRQGAK
jgi:glutathione S-transferase